MPIRTSNLRYCFAPAHTFGGKRNIVGNACQSRIFMRDERANHHMFGIVKAVVAGRNSLGRDVPPPPFPKAAFPRGFQFHQPAKEGPAMTPNTNTISPGSSRDSFAAFPVSTAGAA